MIGGSEQGEGIEHGDRQAPYSVLEAVHDRSGVLTYEASVNVVEIGGGCCSHALLSAASRAVAPIYRHRAIVSYYLNLIWCTMYILSQLHKTATDRRRQRERAI